MGARAVRSVKAQDYNLRVVSSLPNAGRVFPGYRLSSHFQMLAWLRITMV